MIEFTPERKQKLLRIIDYYGPKVELIVGIEEMAELTKELTKHLRYRGQNTDSTAEEIADVYVCLEEMKIALNIKDEQVMQIIEEKVERQLERIREGV